MMGKIFNDANPSIEKTGAYLDYIETCTESIRDTVSMREYTTALTLLAGVRETIDVLVLAVGLEIGIEEANRLKQSPPTAAGQSNRRFKMLLGINNVCAQDCTSGDIVNALSLVAGQEEAFIVVKQSEMTYIQTDGEIVEYQEGSLDSHHFCPDPLTFECIAKAIQSYANGDDWWKTAIRWKKGFWGANLD